MSEGGWGRSRGAQWTWVIGWQIIALVFVLLLGVSALIVASAWSQQAEAQTRLIEDCGKLTGFVTDCLPEASKPKLKELINGWVDFGIEEGMRELDRERRWARDRKDRYELRDYGREKKKDDFKEKPSMDHPKEKPSMDHPKGDHPK